MNSNEKEVMLKSYRKEVELLILKVEIPDIREYESTLLRLFNNKREDRCILDIQNWYGSNEIAIHINLTDYVEDSISSKQDCVEHLKSWMVGGIDVAPESVHEQYGKAYVYVVPDYQNNFKWFEGDNFIRHYIRLED